MERPTFILAAKGNNKRKREKRTTRNEGKMTTKGDIKYRKNKLWLNVQLLTYDLSMTGKKRIAQQPAGCIGSPESHPRYFTGVALFSCRYIPVICYRPSDILSLSSPRFSLPILLQTGQVPCILASKGLQAFLDGSRSAPVYQRWRVVWSSMSGPLPPPDSLYCADGYARTCLDVRCSLPSSMSSHHPRRHRRRVQGGKQNAPQSCECKTSSRVAHATEKKESREVCVNTTARVNSW